MPTSATQDRDNAERLTVRMPREMHEALRIVAFATGGSINDIVIKAVADFLGSQGRTQAVEAFLHRAREDWRVALDKLAGM